MSILVSHLDCSFSWEMGRKKNCSATLNKYSTFLSFNFLIFKVKLRIVSILLDFCEN